MERIRIPRHPDEIIPEWLSMVLRRSGVIPNDVSVNYVDLSDPGREASYAGFVSRLTIEYDRPDVNAPRSIIAKLPATEWLIRSVFRPLYRNEALFYRRLASQVPMQVPACHAALLNRRRTRSLLLLEDLSDHATMGNHGDGCSIEQASTAMASLARFHAQWWNDPALDKMAWLSHYQVDSTRNWMIYTSAWGPYQYRLGHITPHETNALFRSLWRFRDRLRRFEEDRPRSLQHGDFRLANLAFASDDVYVFDWQVIRIGPPLFDVAWFMLTSLDVEQRRDSELTLLRAYHVALTGAGILAYTFEDLLEDYRFALLTAIPQMMVIGAFLRMDDEREVELATMLRQFDALREDHELQSLARG